jgi:hypothetical protein
MTNRSRALVALSLVALPLGGGVYYFATKPSRATEILQISQGDYEYEHKLWMRDPKNWDLGLKATVPAGPDSTATVATIRDLRTEDLVSCAPEGPMPSIYFRTLVTLAKSDGGSIARFHWPTMDAAVFGQKQVETAVESSHGDVEKLYAAIQQNVALEKACVRFTDKLDRCDGFASD